MSASASACAQLPLVCMTAALTLRARSSWTRGASAASAAFEVDDGVERFVVHIDVVERVFGDIPAIGHDHDDGFTGVAYLLLCQGHLRSLMEFELFHRRRRHEQRPRLPELAQVAGGVGGNDAGALLYAAEVHFTDAGVGEVAAQKGDMQHVGHLHIVGEERAAGQQPGILIAFDRLTEKSCRHREAVELWSVLYDQLPQA